ncbi:MAG: NUDIX domain-containing protein [Bacteroidetes bacterium]|nr:NUDIX domain-containing protein [Bacteroidota bacterium]
MRQNYKIFFRRHVLIFQDESVFHGKADTVISHMNKTVIKSLFTHLRRLKTPKTILIRQPGAYSEFLTYFKVVKAAGGGVFNSKGKLLLIHRLGNWDLPKGKLEKGESPYNGSMREVEEECNVHKLTILEELSTTYHIYFQKKWMIKQTYWFAMNSEKFDKAKPQLEEDIDDIKWVNIETLDIENLETYRSIREVLYELQRFAADKVSNHLHSKSNLG